jgi:hypothetical protein
MIEKERIKIEYAPGLDRGNICQVEIRWTIKESAVNFHGSTLEEFLVDEGLPCLVSHNAFLEYQGREEDPSSIVLLYTTHICPTEADIESLLSKQIPVFDAITTFKGEEVDFTSGKSEASVYIMQNDLAQDYKPLTGYLQSEQDFIRYSEFLADEDMQERVMYATNKYFKKYMRGQKPYLKVGSLYYIQNSILPYLQLHSVAKDLALSGEVAFSNKILKDTAKGFVVLQEIQAAVKENREPKHEYLRSLLE